MGPPYSDRGSGGERQGGGWAGHAGAFDVEVAERDAFDRAFETLDAEARAILVLHHLEGRPIAGIAATLAIPIGTAKSRLFTARRRLEAALEREAQEPAGHDLAAESRQ